MVFGAGKDFRSLRRRTVYVIQEEVKMRGIDYQAEGDGGIELLLCSPFSCGRAYEQAVNRVGRNGQEYARFVLAEVTDFVDPAQEK